MIIIKKEVKECDDIDWTKTIVLDLEYTHKWETWKILIKDYKEEFYDDYLKQLRIKVRNAFNEQKMKKDI